MTNLHTINQSPFSAQGLSECLRFIEKEDRLLALEDGVFIVMASEKLQEQLRIKQVKIYVIADDLEARGLVLQTPSSIHKINYSEFVKLTESANQVICWS